MIACDCILIQRHRRFAKTIAQNFALQADHVFVGNGSDEVLAHVFHALLKQDAPLVFPDISYSFYPVYCGLYEIEYKTIPLDDDLCIRLSDYMPDSHGGVGGLFFRTPTLRPVEAIRLSRLRKLS